MASFWNPVLWSHEDDVHRIPSPPPWCIGSHPSTVILVGCPWFHWWSLCPSLPCPIFKADFHRLCILRSLLFWAQGRNMCVGGGRGFGLFPSSLGSNLSHSECKMQAGHNGWEDFLSCNYTGFPPCFPLSWSSSSEGSNSSKWLTILQGSSAFHIHTNSFFI